MTVHSRLEGHVAVLTIDDTAHHNALSTALVRDLLAALRALDAQPVRAVVLAAEGKFFCAGANIDDLHAAGWMQGGPHPEDPVALFEALATHRLPVIAAVAGPALGGGFELCLACDLVVAAESAWFALPEAGLGVVPNTAMARLPAIVGRRRAIELMLTRRRLPASEALAWGLVNATAPAGEVLDKALALARSIVDAAPPGALQAVKDGCDRHLRTDWTEVRASLGRLPHAEWQEGLSAFLEKRPPDFQPFWNGRIS